MAYISFPQRPSRRLGQNFLRDPEVASRIVDSARLVRADVVLEPGAGTGVLTSLIRKRAARVIAVEKDPKLAARLREAIGDYPGVTIIEGDFLRVSLPPFNKVLGTPPYYLSSKLVLFLARTPFEMAQLVFQKEFGERLSAPPGTGGYGRLSVMTQRAFEVKPVFDIPRTAFDPRPKVDSMLIGLEPKPRRNQISPFFEETVRGLFNQRRRLVRSSLSHYLTLKLGGAKARSILERIVLPEGRVYQLSVSQFEAISEQLADFL